nr:hypothetical protein [Paraburkholderia sp. BCC1884]
MNPAIGFDYQKFDIRRIFCGKIVGAISLRDRQSRWSVMRDYDRLAGKLLVKALVQPTKSPTLMLARVLGAKKPARPFLNPFMLTHCCAGVTHCLVESQGVQAVICPQRGAKKPYVPDDALFVPQKPH